MKQTPWMGFAIERRSSVPIFEQICQSIRTQVAAGDLPEGTRLPPTRVYATELGVSRSTMVTAYEQLVAEGYLASTPGSGYRVCPVGEIELTAKPRAIAAAVREEEVSPPRPFQAGYPDMRLFPHAQWAKTVARVCRNDPRAMLVGASPLGSLALRRAVAQHVSDWRGIEAKAEQILITAGSGDALELCIHTLTGLGDCIALEDPGYLPLRSLVSTLGLQQLYLKIDEQGARLPEPSQKARLVVLTPSHQFPLGGAMSPGRRLAFTRWAEENDSWIVEDDYDSEFRYAGRPIPAMAGFDKLRRTIYIGSLSKIFSNSLRLGYLVVPEPLLEAFKARLKQFGTKASLMPQQALAEFISNGDFYRHLRRMRRVYGERRKFLLERLADDFNSFGSFQDHQAGMQIALHLRPDFPDLKVSKLARARGVLVRPLSTYCVVPAARNGLLLGFCAFSEAEMGTALDGLAEVLADWRVVPSR